MGETSENRERCAVKDCYRLLHSIEKCDEYNKVEDFCDEFITKLDKVKKSHRRYLYDPEILDGKFTGYSGETSGTTELPEEDIYGETLLFRAVSNYNGRKKKTKKGNLESSKTDTRQTYFDKDSVWKEIIEYVIETVPEMIFFPNLGEAYACVRYSPFYLAIVKKHTDVIEQMILQIETYKLFISGFDVFLADGSAFGNTVMLAGTPLGVAALTMDKCVFRKVLKLYKEKNGIKLVTENIKHDTIIHSMIKYIKENKDQLKQAKEMLSYILDADSWRITSHKPEGTVKHLAMSKNDEHLTPLQLAAKLQQFELFEIIIHSKNYFLPHTKGGLITQCLYDITELDTTTVKEEKKGSSEENVQVVNHNSVLRFVNVQDIQTAFRFADLLPVRAVVKEKWSRYRYFFYPWFFMHLVFMCLLSRGAVMRTSLQFQLKNETGNNTVKDDPTSLGVSIMGCCVGSCIILIYAFRLYSTGLRPFIKASIKRLIKLVQNMSGLRYTNHIYEWFFGNLAAFLIADLGFLFVNEYDNKYLVFALLFGWYCVLFFLQVFRRLSFFTVLIQRVSREMFNFAIVMGFLLVGFTVAMFVVMQGGSTTNDDFSSFPKTLLTMFTIMLGIGEISDISNAKNPILATFVFFSFVLLTTILLLNALIAMMSNSYTVLMDFGRGADNVNKMHETLQELSVIIFLESFLPERLHKKVGIQKENRRILKIRTKTISENKGKLQDYNEIHQSFQKILRKIDTHAMKNSS